MRNYQRYNGSVPNELSRPIRAGLLLNVDRDRLAFTGQVLNLIVHTNQCNAYVIENRKANRPKYQGLIPSQLSRPIRAGPLLHVDRERLVGLIASLEPLRSEEPDDAPRAERAAQLIDEIRAVHANVQLADNCFCPGAGHTQTRAL